MHSTQQAVRLNHRPILTLGFSHGQIAPVSESKPDKRHGLNPVPLRKGDKHQKLYFHGRSKKRAKLNASCKVTTFGKVSTYDKAMLWPQKNLPFWQLRSLLPPKSNPTSSVSNKSLPALPEPPEGKVH